LKTKSIQQDQETICRLIYNESLSFHPEQEDPLEAKDCQAGDKSEKDLEVKD
jgi:hypothetical protein